MLERIVRGIVPAKHHTALRDVNGRLLYEHCHTRQGFEGPYTISYHLERPHIWRAVDTAELAELRLTTPLGFPLAASAGSVPLRRRHFQSAKLREQGTSLAASTAFASTTPLAARIPLLFNADIVISALFPQVSDSLYFSNGDADDLFYIHQGAGTLRSALGDLAFQSGDYLFIPRGLLHRFLLPEGLSQSWLSLECFGALGLLPQWLNAHGQLRMGAPYCHRDFQNPVFNGPRDEDIRLIVVKRQNQFDTFAAPHSPLDVVGYDGAVYPLVFPISKFQPRVGQVHLPPTVHGTFATRGALICSFVPRPVDFDRNAVPCPYPHSSVDVDEVLFYAQGNFTSRRGIESGSLSLHPAGIPHGPHPGAYEASIGSSRTDELAVMIDCSQPLALTSFAREIEDPGYDASFG